MAIVRTPASVFGGPVTRVPSFQQLRLLDDAQRAVLDVDPPSLERSQLAEAQAIARGQQDEDAEPTADEVGDLVDLRHRGDRALRRPLDAGVLRMHGFLRTSSSSTAVRMIVLSNRYALAIVDGPGLPAAISVACQARVSPV